MNNHIGFLGVLTSQYMRVLSTILKNKKIDSGFWGLLTIHEVFSGNLDLGNEREEILSHVFSGSFDFAVHHGPVHTTNQQTASWLVEDSDGRARHLAAVIGVNLCDVIRQQPVLRSDSQHLDENETWSVIGRNSSCIDDGRHGVSSGNWALTTRILDQPCVMMDAWYAVLRHRASGTCVTRFREMTRHV